MAKKQPSLSLIDLHLDYLRASAKDDLAGWHRALLRGCGRRVLGGRECGLYEKRGGRRVTWVEVKNLAHHIAGGGPGALDGLTALQVLDLNTSCSWRRRCRAARRADGAADLNLQFCSGLTSLPSLDGLTALQTLNLGGCTGLTSLSLDGLTALQTLDLGGCSGLTSLSLDGLTALQKLDLRHCSGLTSLSLDGLTALQTLNLRGCSSLTSLSLDRADGAADAPPGRLLEPDVAAAARPG